MGDWANALDLGTLDQSNDEERGDGTDKNLQYVGLRGVTSSCPPNFYFLLLTNTGHVSLAKPRF